MHYPKSSLMQFDDDTLERVRMSVPSIFEAKKTRLEEQKKEDERFLKNGYQREYWGGVVRWYKR